MQNKVIILVGSNSVHTQRFLYTISSLFIRIVFITNHTDQLNLSENLITHTVNFKLSNIKARFQIAKIIQQYPGAIVHIHQANSYAYHTLKAVKLGNLPCKTILTTWGSDILVLPEKSIVLKHIVKFNLSNSDIITSDSLYMSAKIKQLCPNVKELHTINFGMQHFPKALDLSHKTSLILSNRLHKPLYNIDKIIHGFAQLIQHSPEFKYFKLIIASSGTETDKLKQQAADLNLDPEQIVFTGMIGYDELVNYYRQAKIFISIPDSDATSLSVLEAMGHGCYPILANLPANLEWVIDNFNGTINQNTAQLDTDIEQAIRYTNDTSKYHQVASFNYNLIKEKGVFEDNIQKFIALYQ